MPKISKPGSNLPKIASPQFCFTLITNQMEEITFESHPVSYIHMLEQEIIDNHPSRLTSDDIEDVSDNYQAHLEYKWWKAEQLELIKDLKSKLTPEQLKWYEESKG